MHHQLPIALTMFVVAIILCTTGMFNVSNKLLVSLDILLRMREHVQKDHLATAEAVFRSTLKMPNAPQLPEKQVWYLVEKLYDGFFAFEALTDRDWDLGICGIYSICPQFESGEGNCKNCAPVTNSIVKFSQHTYTQTSCSVYMITFPLR